MMKIRKYSGKNLRFTRRVNKEFKELLRGMIEIDPRIRLNHDQVINQCLLSSQTETTEDCLDKNHPFQPSQLRKD